MGLIIAFVIFIASMILMLITGHSMVWALLVGLVLFAVLGLKRLTQGSDPEGDSAGCLTGNQSGEQISSGSGLHDAGESGMPFGKAVKELAASSVDFVLRVWTKASDYWDVFFNTNERIYTEFNKQGIGFPFPQIQVHQTHPQTPPCKEGSSYQ